MSDQTPVQLSLKVSLQDEATFDNFFPGRQDAAAVLALKQASEGRGEGNLLIWGGDSAGLSHLLQACCHRSALQGGTAQYLPLDVLSPYNPEDIVEGLDVLSLLCLDRLEAVCGDARWENALFHLYNRLRDRSATLIIATHLSPNQLPIGLPDLRSRVLGSVVFRVRGLEDEEKAQALILRAHNRGMSMSTEVAQYILTRTSRKFADVCALLNILDEASLQQQRKLSIPFVKGILDAGTPSSVT